MTDHSEFEIRLAAKEYSALMNIRGLEPSVYSMVMTATYCNNGDWIISGTYENIDKLMNDLWTELKEDLSPNKYRPALGQIYDRIISDYLE